MVCELLLLSAVWFLFVAFWLETVSVWVFLCNFYQDRGFYLQRRWAPRAGGVGGGAGGAAITRVSVEEPGQLLHILGRQTLIPDNPCENSTCARAGQHLEAPTLMEG